MPDRKYRRSRSSWAIFRARVRQGTPWKIHLYADSPSDWLAVASVILPYLQERRLLHKTVASLGMLAAIAGGHQSGKAFTVYFDDVEQFAMEATRLRDLIVAHGLERADATIAGDRPLGRTGRLFYRFDEDGHGNYRPNDGRRHRPPGIQDPFLRLARQL